MTKAIPFRKQDILSKLEYVKARHAELMEELFRAKTESRDPAFLAHTAADILSTLRECFDYLGQDIIECYIIANTTSQKIKGDYKTGKLKAYFPYYSSQITKSDSIFQELFLIEPSLYQSILDFTSSIESKATIPGTLFKYQLFVEVKDMVNDKKHNKLIGFISNDNQEYIVQNEGLRMIIPAKEQSGFLSFLVEPGTQVSKVTEYRFEHNNSEIGKFCHFATLATRMFIISFYDKHFA